MRLICTRCDWISFESDDRGQIERQYKGHVAARHHLSLQFDPHPYYEWQAVPYVDPTIRRKVLTWAQEMDVRERGSGYLLADSEVLEQLFAVFGIETEITRQMRLDEEKQRPVVVVPTGPLL